MSESNPWGANPFDDDQQQSSEPHYLTNGTDRQDNHQPLRGDNLSPNYDDGRPRPPILANYMYKLKHKPSYIGSWVRRYWKINIRTEALEYYTNEEESNKGTNPHKVIPIKNIIAVRSIGDYFMQFIVTTEIHQQVIYNLKVENTDVKEMWVRDLGNYFQALKDFELELKRNTPVAKPIPTLTEGYLFKLKHKPSNFGSWNKRFFKIDPIENTFKYYKSSGSSDVKHCFQMSEITAVRQADEWTVQVELGDPMTEIYTLQAPSKEDFIMWMTSIEKYLEDKRTYDDWVMMQSPAPSKPFGW